MARILTALVAAILCAQPVLADVWQARYGVAETFNFPLFNADGTLDVDEADGGTEVSVSCNEGAETTATNDFADEGTFYSIALTATEMQCERIAVVIAATTTHVFFIETYANASAMTPTYEANVASVTTGAIENQDFATAPGAAGGLAIAGSNAATTFATLTVSGATTLTGRVDLDAGLDIAQSTSNADAVVIAGNGTGDGVQINSGSGATGDALKLIASSTNGNGMSATGSGTGNGYTGVGGATSGEGMNLVGSGTGDGLQVNAGNTGGGAAFRALATGGNTSGFMATGTGTGHGAIFTGGNGATGNGAQFTSTATNGSGIGLTPTGSGTGINGTLATVTTATTTTNVTNAPTAGDLTATMKTSVQTAAAAALDGEDGGNFTALVTAILQGNGVPAPTTIASLSSQTSFTLTAGSADDNAYNGYGIVIRDASTATQQALGCVRDYTGSSKTVTLLEDPAIFTMATTDNVALLPAFCDAQVIQDLYETALLICTVDTANFAGDTNDFACDLTDRAGAAVTANMQDNDLAGLEVVILTGAQQYEKRFVGNTTDWDGTNNEMRLSISRVLPATLADGVIAIIR